MRTCSVGDASLAVPDQHHRAARFRDDAADRRHQPLQPDLHAECAGGQQRDLHGGTESRSERAGGGPQRDDMRWTIWSWHVRRHLLRRRADAFRPRSSVIGVGVSIGSHSCRLR